LIEKEAKILKLRDKANSLPDCVMQAGMRKYYTE